MYRVTWPWVGYIVVLLMFTILTVFSTFILKIVFLGELGAMLIGVVWPMVHELRYQRWYSRAKLYR
jgi:hypothetical protein